MKKATEALLSDHKMIRKLMEGLQTDNPRFGEISKTMTRVVLTHAWFEDNVFLPAFKNEPLLIKNYMDQLYDEHKDIDTFMKLIRSMPDIFSVQMEATLKQFKAIMRTHLEKEEEALFPLAEKILDNEGLNKLGAEMEKRQREAQKLFL